jgi:DNA-binding transcriptional LysR family regulator
MKLQQLSALIALVEAGSMRGAARELAVTQPALSARIAELEREVGATLVNRNARGTTLTSVGHALLGHARTICNQVDRAEADIARMTRSCTASVALGASPLAAGELIAPLFRTFQRRVSGVHLKVREGQFHELATELREGGLEMILASIPPGGKDTKAFRFEELVTYPMYVIARAGHAMAGYTRLADLADASWVVGAATSMRLSTVEEVYASHGLPLPNIELNSDAITLVQTCLIQTDLLGLLPVPLFAPLGDQVVVLPIQDLIRPIRLGLITLAGVPLSPAAHLLTELVRERSEAIAMVLAQERRLGNA